jgi:phage baseplate assembly protein W
MGPRYIAWRFSHPDVGAYEGPPGLHVAPTGQLATVAESDSVRQAILILLTTRPGERVMRPEYGCNLDALVFSPNDDTTAGLAIHYVRQALQQWEPRVDILAVDASAAADDPSRLDITLDYRVRSTPWNERLVVPISLAAAAP